MRNLALVELALAGAALAFTLCIWPIAVVGRVSEWIATE
jgi:hypothetical protein